MQHEPTPNSNLEALNRLRKAMHEFDKTIRAMTPGVKVTSQKRRLTAKNNDGTTKVS